MLAWPQGNAIPRSDWSRFIGILSIDKDLRPWLRICYQVAVLTGCDHFLLGYRCRRCRWRARLSKFALAPAARVRHQLHIENLLIAVASVKSHIFYSTNKS